MKTKWAVLWSTQLASKKIWTIFRKKKGLNDLCRTILAYQQGLRIKRKLVKFEDIHQRHVKYALNFAAQTAQTVAICSAKITIREFMRVQRTEYSMRKSIYNSRFLLKYCCKNMIEYW
jgi:hypothetical protein